MLREGVDPRETGQTTRRRTPQLTPMRSACRPVSNDGGPALPKPNHDSKSTHLECPVKSVLHLYRTDEWRTVRSRHRWPDFIHVATPRQALTGYINADMADSCSIIHGLLSLSCKVSSYRTRRSKTRSPWQTPLGSIYCRNGSPSIYL